MQSPVPGCPIRGSTLSAQCSATAVIAAIAPIFLHGHRCDKKHVHGAMWCHTLDQYEHGKPTSTPPTLSRCSFTPRLPPSSRWSHIFCTFSQRRAQPSAEPSCTRTGKYAWTAEFVVFRYRKATRCVDRCEWGCLYVSSPTYLLSKPSYRTLPRDIHPHASISRIYFENVFCLLPDESTFQDGMSQVGVRVALGDISGSSSAATSGALLTV